MKLVYLVEYWRSWDSPEMVGIFTTLDAAREVLTGLGFMLRDYGSNIWRNDPISGGHLSAKITTVELNVIISEPRR